MITQYPNSHLVKENFLFLLNIKLNSYQAVQSFGNVLFRIICPSKPTQSTCQEVTHDQKNTNEKQHKYTHTHCFQLGLKSFLNMEMFKIRETQEYNSMPSSLQSEMTQFEAFKLEENGSVIKGTKFRKGQLIPSAK